MARGKDGFDSLLVKSEGGEAEEIVSEENGILISMMLRQYFMSLKIMGQWKMWGKSMDRHWKEVQSSMPQSPEIAKGGFKFPPDTAKNASKPNENEDPLDESDDDISADESEDVKASTQKRERDIKLIRKVTRKWWRLAGLKGEPKCCDEMGEGELTVDWTRVSITFIMKGKNNMLTVVGNCTKIRRPDSNHLGYS